MKSLRLLMACLAAAAFAQDPPQTATGARDLNVTSGKSVLIDSAQTIERIAVTNFDVAEAVAIDPHEVMVNGKAPGQTSLIVWQQGGNRLIFDLNVLPNETRLEAVRGEMSREMGNENVTLDVQGDTVFLRGDVRNLTEAERAVVIASTLGKPVNLLRVAIPATDPQILLKVRFADVDRSNLQNLGINLFSTGATNTIGSISTGQFTPPTVSGSPTTGGSIINLAQALNLFLFRPDLNLGATIQALQSKGLLQILAEPNVLAINGHTASFLEGGEFPFPSLQGGATVGAVTVQFREFGVRLNFTPIVTPRGTIRLTVQPEVSSLDFANGLVFQGFTIPALDTRRVQTEIELEDGQSFAISGLLDNRDTETLNRIPGLASIPFFGKLFQSRSINKTNTELLVLVTPEVVRPIPAGQSRPDLNMPSKFLPPNTSSTPPQTPGPDVTGPVPPSSPSLGRGQSGATIPVEQLIRTQQQTQQAPSTPQIQYVPVPIQPVQPITPAAPTPGTNPQPANPQANPPSPQPTNPH
jgi:pilus assembly protein CpaC